MIPSMWDVTMPFDLHRSVIKVILLVHSHTNKWKLHVSGSVASIQVFLMTWRSAHKTRKSVEISPRCAAKVCMFTSRIDIEKRRLSLLVVVFSTSGLMSMVAADGWILAILRYCAVKPLAWKSLKYLVVIVQNRPSRLINPLEETYPLHQLLLILVGMVHD